MDGFGDLFGDVGEMLGGMFGGDAAAEGVMGIADFLSPDGRKQREPGAPVVYERYLCGKPRDLNINDR